MYYQYVKKLFKKLVNLLISEIENINSTRSISLFAERELVKFYQKLGFIEQEEVYFNDIPNVKMVKRKNILFIH